MPGSSTCSAASVDGCSVTAGSSDHLPAWSSDFCAAVDAAVRAALRPQAVQREHVRVLAAGRLAGAFGLARDGQAERRLPADGQGVVLGARPRGRRGAAGRDHGGGAGGQDARGAGKRQGAKRLGHAKTPWFFVGCRRIVRSGGATGVGANFSMRT